MGNRPPGPFAYHQATPEAVDTAAESITNTRGALATVTGSTRSATAGATASAHGQLIAPLQVPGETVVADATALEEAAVFAGGAVHLFADVVRDFDDGVAGLNTEYGRLVAERDNLAASRTGGADRLPAPDVGEVYGERLAALRARYDTELRPMLDDGASLVRTMLDGGPNEQNVRVLWSLSMARNVNGLFALPGAFPELGLWGRGGDADLTAALNDPALSEDLVELVPATLLTTALNDPRLPAGVRNLILSDRPDAVAQFSATWKLETAGRVPDVDCRPNSNGGIIGPDGRIYWVDIPRSLGPGEHITAEGDMIHDDGPGSGWSTVDGRYGSIEHGEPVPGLERAIWVVSGTKYPGDSWSIGSDQTDYMTVTPDGRVVLNPDIYVPENAHGGMPPSPPPEDYHRSVNAGDYAELVTNFGEGLVTGDKVEANRHGASYVTFQENADGTLRAVITINQARTDGEDVYVDSTYGTLGPDGSVVPHQSG